MKQWTLTLAGVVALALIADLVVAQQRGGGGRGQQSQQRERFGGPPAQAPGGGQYGPGSGQFGPGFGQQFHHPLMVVLDTDKDGEISASEIKNAAKALLKLDKNEDGKLTLDELRPEGAPGRGAGFGPGQGGPGRGGQAMPGGPRRGFGGPGQGGPGQGGAGGAGRGGFGAGGFAERLMQMDANNDGKVTADEVPERMQMMLKRFDANGDGAIDAEEVKAFAAQFQQGAGRGPGAAGEQRPQRGQRPQSDW